MGGRPALVDGIN